MTLLYEAIAQLEYLGVADVILPFLLIFTISFAVLSRTKILGESKQGRRFDAVISLVFGLSLVIPHVMGRYPWGMSPVDIINRSLPDIAVFLVGIILLFLLVGAFGVKWKGDGNSAGALWVIISIGIVVYVFGTNAGWFLGGQFPNWLWWLQDPGTQSLLVVLIVFIIIVWFITRDDEGKEKDENSIFKLFKDMTQTEKL